MSPWDCEYHSREYYLLSLSLQIIGKHMRLDMIYPIQWLLETEWESLCHCSTGQQWWCESWRASTGYRIYIRECESRLPEDIIDTGEYSIGMTSRCNLWYYSSCYIMFKLSTSRHCNKFPISHKSDRGIITRCFEGEEVHITGFNDL